MHRLLPSVSALYSGAVYDQYLFCSRTLEFILNPCIIIVSKASSCAQRVSRSQLCRGKKVKYIVDLYSASTRSVSKALRYSTHCQGISQFYLHTLRFVRKRNEPYLPLPSQPQLVLIYRPRRDGRLSRPWCEIAQAEIRTCNLPIADPALYHRTTSAPNCCSQGLYH